MNTIIKDDRFVIRLGWLVFLASLPAASNAFGFVTVKTQNSVQGAHWSIGQTLTYRANTTNRSGLSSSDVFNSLTTSLLRWKQAALDQFSFLYYQGTDTSKYPVEIGKGQDNSIFFTSQTTSSNKLACGIVGLTSIWFDTGDNHISKADIRINDDCYQFTMVASDTQKSNKIYLSDLITHEMGHSLGLDHSQNVQSTMVYTATRQASLPSCDDQAAVRSLYAPNRSTGKIVGRVYSENGYAVSGAHVTAVSLNRGVPMASALTDRDGSFLLDELEPGSYTLVTEPYYPGSGSLSSYYKDISAAICGGKNFERSFQKSSNSLVTHFIDSGQTLDAGSIVASCSKIQSQGGGAENQINTAPTLQLDHTSLHASRAVVGVYSSSSDHYYRIPSAFGKIKASATAYGLYSMADVNVRFLNTSGQVLSQQTSSSNLFSSSLPSGSGYTNFDSIAEVQLDKIQDVIMHVYTRRYSSYSDFPSSSTGVDQTPYYVLGVTHSDSIDSVYAQNGRCEMADEFSSYNSLGEAPGLSEKGSTKKDNGSGGCGTIVPVSEEDPFDGPGAAGSMMRLINFIGFCFASLLIWLKMRQNSTTY